MSFHLRPTRPLTCVALLLWLGGCAQIPYFENKQQMSKIETYASTETLKAQDMAWPETKWWTKYGNTQLNTLIEKALTDSPDLSIAVSRLNRATSIIQQAHSLSGPNIAANASTSNEKMSYNYLMPAAATPQGWTEVGIASIDLKWDLDFWGRHKAALLATQYEQEAALAEVNQSKLIIATNVALAYAEYQRLYSQRQVHTQTIQVRKNIEALVKQRVEAGLDNQSNLFDAQAKRAAIENQLLRSEEHLQLQRLKISALIGSGPDYGLTLNQPLSGTPIPYGLPQNIKAELLGRRADIRTARMRVEAQYHRIDQKKAEFYPNINLTAFIGLQALGLNRLNDSGSDTGHFGAAITLPVFTAGRLKGELRATLAIHDEMVALYNKTIIHALNEIAENLTSRKSIELQSEKIKYMYESLHKNALLVQSKYESGLATYIDVLNAQEAALNALTQYNDIKTRTFALDILMTKSLGGGSI